MRKGIIKKAVCLALSAVMMMGVMTGCGTSKDSSSASEKDTKVSAEQEADDGSTGDSGMSGAISVVSRENGSGTRGAFVELTGVEEKDADGNKVDNTTLDAIIANSTDVVMNNIAGDTNAIGYISLGSLNDKVKAIKVDGVEASVDTVKDGSYAISRPFNIATKTDEALSDAAQDFYDFILSAEGQQIVEDNKYIKIDEAAPEFESNGASGKVVVAGSSSVTPVMEKLKEAYEAINSGVTVEVQQSDSSTGIQAAIEGTCDIGMASRDLSDEEASSLTATQIALDGIAVIVNPENTTDSLTLEQVKGIFTGEITDWSLN